MNWNDGITEFGFDCKVRKLSPKTISNYTKQLWYTKNKSGTKTIIKSAAVGWIICGTAGGIIGAIVGKEKVDAKRANR